MSREIEEARALDLEWDKLATVASSGVAVVPVVLQHADSSEVLFVAYANELALAETFRTETAVLWSTSRNELWVKGATSGDTLDLIEVRVNCEQNSLLYLVRPREGGVCHTRVGGDPDGATRSRCYYRVVDPDGSLRSDD